MIEKFINEAIARKVMEAREKHPKPSFAALVEEFLELTKDIQENNPYWHLEAIDCITVLFRLLTERHFEEAKDL